MIPHLPFAWWLSLTMMVLCVVLFEYAYRIAGMFTDLQLDALALLRDLDDFAKRNPNPHPEGGVENVVAIRDWIVKIQGEYLRKFKKRVQTLNETMAIAGKPIPRHMNNYKEHITDLDSVHLIRADLWRVILREESVDLEEGTL